MLIATRREEKKLKFFFFSFFGYNFLGHKVCSGSFPFCSAICGDALESQNIVKSL